MKEMTADAGNVLAPAARSKLATLAELVKARLTSLVLVTTSFGFCMGSLGSLNWTALLNVLVGTGLLAGGAACLNQWLERHLDARMRRTRDRPLPSGRVDAASAMAFGVACALVGLVYLSLFVNRVSALLGAATLVTYLLVYTPMKTRSGLNTVIGAVPGALPPLIGWTAAQGEITVGGWVLFAVQFFWQLPHFLAIAWLYRDDYALAGFKMLPVIDPSGERTAHHAVGHTLALLTASLAPFALGLTGAGYVPGAIVLGAGFFFLTVRFAVGLQDGQARRLFWGSILYLPALLGLMVWNKAG